MTSVEPAFAKVNLCLFLGGGRADGRHELVTVFESVTLSDQLRVSVGAQAQDEVHCPGIEGPNLVGDALAALRAIGWDAPLVRVEIDKRIPVAAGMGGGSADAAAMLRHAHRLAPVPRPVVAAIAAGLGSDVPGQLDPGPSLGTAAGDVIQPLAALAPHGLVVLPLSFGLSTAEVYGEADRLGLARPAEQLVSLRAELERVMDARESDAPLPERLIVNDLQPAALSLRPEIGGALERAREAGADRAMVCGSGPTVIGLCWGAGAVRRAGHAADSLRRRFPAVVAVQPVVRGVLEPTPNE